MGKLCQKLGYSHDTSLSYYDKAIGLNQSAVDALYRMHASRLKLLWTCEKQNVEVLKVSLETCCDFENLFMNSFLFSLKHFPIS